MTTNVRARSEGEGPQAGTAVGHASQVVVVRQNIKQSGLDCIFEDGVPLGLENAAPRRGYLLTKRLFDIVLSAATLVLLGPLMVLVALAVIVTSRGPVFFRQARFGKNGQPFHVFKFRSMYVDGANAQRTANGHDARITPLGGLLRRTSIDELPQLFNILGGEMSFVGPRPHPIEMLAAGRPYEDAVPYYAKRAAVVPGLSGWAQLNGLRGATTDAELALARINHDLAYIQNMSFWLDLRIIAGTIRREFLSGSGT